MAATSVKELSKAMQYSSATAQQVGIDFDHLAAYIGTVSSTTRLSAETIGQSMKTISARMTAIKDMKTFDDEGENINNVEKALRGVDVSLRDTDGSFRDMQDVLDELSARWGEFTDEEKMFIAQQIGGVRQQNVVLSLLSNRVEIQKQLTAEINSTGLAEERYKIFLEGVEAAQNKMTASWEKLVMSTATGDMVAGFYDGVAAALDFVDSIGGIPTVLKIVIPLLVLFNLELIKTKSIAIGNTIWGLGASLVGFGKDLGAAIALMRTGTSATTALNLAFGTTAVTVGALALALASVVAVIYTYNEQVTKTQQAGIEESANHWATLFEEVKTNGGDAIDVLEKYRAGVDAINKSHEQGGIIADMFVDKQAMIDEGLKETVIALGKTSTSYDDYIKKVKEAAAVAGYQTDEKGAYKSSRYGNQYVEDLAIPTAQEFTDQLNKALAEQEVLLFGDPQALIEQAKETGSEVGKAVYEGFSETLKGLADTSSTMDDLIKKSNEGGLTIEDAASIPPEYLSALTVVGDKLKINIDLLKQTQLEQAATALSAIQSAYDQGDATAQQVAVVQFAYDQLLAQSQNTFGQFNQTAWQYDALLWQIANDAEAAGYQFTDMEGKALTSAQNIHEYLASSPQAFSNFVTQVANATGRTVQEVTNIINQMINNTIARLNSLGGMSGGMSPDERDEAGGSSTPAGGDVVLFPAGGGGGGGSGGGSGGGGGGESDEAREAREEAERLREIEREIEEARRDASDALKDQLSTYKKIIDARKKIISTLADERQYQQDVEDKNKSILKVQNELSALQFDDSEEANARRLELQDQLAELQQDLEDINYEQSVQTQMDALDAEYEAFQAQIEAALAAIGNITAGSLEEFAAQLAVILSGLSTPPSVPTYHSGAEQGLVSGSGTSVKGNEILAKLLTGELVSTPKQGEDFIRKTLPQLVQGATTMNGGDMQVSIPIQVMGNLDRDALPGLEKMVKAAVEQINKNMLNRGYTRRAENFGN